MNAVCLLLNMGMNPSAFGWARIVKFARATRLVTTGALACGVMSPGVRLLLIRLLILRLLVALLVAGRRSLPALFSHTTTIFCCTSFGNGVWLPPLIGRGVIAPASLAFATTLVFRPATRLVPPFRLVAVPWLNAQPAADRRPESEQIEQYPMRFPAFMAGFVTSS